MNCSKILCNSKALDAYGMICTAIPALLTGVSALIFIRNQDATLEFATHCVNKTIAALPSNITCIELGGEIAINNTMAKLFSVVGAGLSAVGAIGWAALRIKKVNVSQEARELASDFE